MEAASTAKIPIVVWFALVMWAGPAPKPATEAEEIFANEVKPLLEAKCLGCHGPTKTSGLSLQSRDGLLQGGSRGPAITPGDPGKSLLVSALEQQGSLKMPPGGKLTGKEIAAVSRWIELGAPWPDRRTAAPEVRQTTDDRWAFQPVRHYDPPRVRSADAGMNPIDAFILAKLEQKKIPPTRRADRRMLIRRVTYDLTGLPPTPEEVDAFLRNPAPDPGCRAGHQRSVALKQCHATPPQMVEQSKHCKAAAGYSVMKQQPGPGSDQNAAGDARDEFAERRHLLQQHQHRQRRDPQHIHHAANKQQ